MKLLALDGNSIINRAYYGIPLLSSKDGQYTNGIYGFMNILLRLTQDVNPDIIIAAFDLKEPTFRHKQYAEYKAGRKAMPQELAEQMPVIKDVLKRFGCICLEQPGYEADDILGTVAEKSVENGDTCVIATGDRDALQLVNDNVSVYLTATKRGKPEVTVYNRQVVQEQYGVTPPQLLEIKALQGDASDNIPGIAGVGPKTASTLIQNFTSIDYIYENIDTIDIKDNLRERLKNSRDDAFLSRELGRICTTVPIQLPNECCYKSKMDKQSLKAILINLEMFKLIERLNLNDVVSEDTPSQSQSLDSKEIAPKFDPEALPDNSIVYYDNKSGVLSAKNGNDYFIFKDDFKSKLTAKKIITHDIKTFYHNVDVSNPIDFSFDTMLAAYLIDPDQNDYSLDRFLVMYPQGNYKEDDHSEIFRNLDLIENLYLELKQKIDANQQQTLLNEIEIPLSFTLYSMEKEGFLIDSKGLVDYSEMLGEKLQQLEKDIFNIIGYEFNLNSPKQLSEALFVKLGLPHSKKTKTGFSTSAEVLESLKDESEAVELLQQYRTIAKLKSTYCDGLLKVISDDGRIHTTFKQTETRTGRISSVEPNLQNIPVRTELGKQLRKFFIAKENHMLVDADYSQIELRVLAHISDDKNMIDAFLNNEDIHAITASQVFDVPLEMVTEDLRSKAKAVNFGIVYGIGAFSLSKDINVSVAKAKKYIDNYLATYSNVSNYMHDTIKNAKETGFVTTTFGRRRYLKELSSPRFNIRAFGERVAMNTPIQGTAADIIKIAMIKVHRRLKDEKLNAKLILQVHDELICEVPEDEVEQVKKIVKEEMQSAVSLKVPMLADVKCAKTWYDSK